MTTLIITEKPNAAKKMAQALADSTINEKKYLKVVPYYEIKHKKKDLIITCAVGHLYNLDEKKKGPWTYPVFNIEWKEAHLIGRSAKFTKKYLDSIKKLAKKCDKFVLACDLDLEGELIGYNVLRFACKQKDGLRMEFSTLTKDELVKSFENAKPHVNKQLAISAETRHILDHIFGINLSRALTLSVKNATKMFKLLSTGRVQGPALKILYKREKEIEAFKAEPFWEIELQGNKQKTEVIAWHKQDKFWKKPEAEQVLKNTKNKNAVVQSVKTSKRKIKPPAPFDLTSLQIEAYSTIKITPKITLEYAQDLYSNGYISYPRTSSQKLPESIGYKKITKALSNKFPDECKLLLNKKSLKPNEGKKIDAAHPAIYPTGETPKITDQRKKKLYELIVRRFFATFGEEAEREHMTVEIDCNKEIFLTKGSRTTKQGWYELYGQFAKQKEEDLPKLKEKDKIDVKEIILHAKETQPPKRFTEASIIKELEKLNLGTKATRSSIIENLFDRNYVSDRSIIVTTLGKTVIELLEKYCPEVLDEELTRNFEEEIGKVERKERKEKEVIEEYKKFLEKVLTKFKEKEKEIGEVLAKAYIETRDTESFVGKCHACKEGDLQIRTGKFGPFIACNKYPDCKTTVSLPGGALVRPAKKNCEICNFPKILIITKGRRPDEVCINKECSSKDADESLVKGKACPKCGKDLVIKKTLRGPFIGCSGYPECRHIQRIKKEESKDS